MSNTAHILNFSQLLYSLNIEEDIKNINSRINDYFLDNFDFYLSAFYFFYDNNVKYYDFTGDDISESELEECRIIVSGLFHDISREDIVCKTCSLKKSASLIFFPVLSSGKCKGIFALFLKYRISEEEKESVSKIIIDIGSILLEKIMENQEKNRYFEIAREYNREMETASLLHKKIIPQDRFDFSEIEICVKYRPYRLIGGDYYNCFRLENGKRFLVVMADAAGKGMAGALISNMFHVIVKYISITQNISDLEQICRNINAFMCESIDNYHFISCVFMLIDCENNKLDICNCGHSSPVIVHDGEIISFEEGNPPMGIDEVEYYEISEYKFDKDDFFLMWTDGFAESEEETSRLYELLSEYDMLSIDNTLKLLYSKMDRENYPDDITLIAGKFRNA